MPTASTSKAKTMIEIQVFSNLGVVSVVLLSKILTSRSRRDVTAEEKEKFLFPCRFESSHSVVSAVSFLGLLLNACITLSP